MRRWALLLGAPLAATAALRANDSEQASRTERAAPTRSSDPSRPSLAAAEALPRLDLQRLQALSRRHASEQPPVDPFAAEAMVTPAIEHAAMKAEPPAPPPPPQAPALPFRFIGRQDADGDGDTLIFLEQQNQTHIVRVGETVADGWRLEGADDQALTFTYVPLGQQRRLATGSAG